MLRELGFSKGSGLSKGSQTTSLDKGLTYTATYWVISKLGEIGKLVVVAERKLVEETNV